MTTVSRTLAEQGAAARFRIAENIRFFRRSRGWTQTELCGRLAESGVEMSKASLSAIERGPTNGRNHSLPADLVAAFAFALQVTPNDLFGVVAEPSSYGAGFVDGRRSAFARVTEYVAGLRAADVENLGGER